MIFGLFIKYYVTSAHFSFASSILSAVLSELSAAAREGGRDAGAEGAEGGFSSTLLGRDIHDMDIWASLRLPAHTRIYERDKHDVYIWASCIREIHDMFIWAYT